MEDKKKKQLHKWFSEEELSVLSGLVNEEEIIKSGNVYPDLYSQMSYAMEDIAGFKESIALEINSIASEIGFSEVAEFLLDSVPLFIFTELGVKDCLQEMEPEQCISAERLMLLHNSVYARINTAKHFLKMEHLRNRIRIKEGVAKLATNGVLI